MLFFCVIILVVNIVLWLLFYKFLKKSFSAKGILKEIKSEAENIIVQINKETDIAVTLIESKLSIVRQMIDMLDKKILMYEDTMIQKENEKKYFEQLADVNNSYTVKKAIHTYKTNSVNNNDNLSLFTENAGTEDLKNTKKTSSKKESEKKDTTLELDFSKNEDDIKILKTVSIEPNIPIQEQIIKLAKEGFNPELIAKKLNISINVVTMTIDLYL